jgi:hypothetical protein
MKYRIIGALGFLALLILLPALMREKPAVPDTPSQGSDTIVIITPHAESIKHEFERGFQRYYLKKFNRNIVIDWRSPGGTADIVRYINDRYEAAFRHYCEENALPWNDKTAAAFRDPRQKPDRSAGASDEARVRAAFLESDVSIGIDVFFGGGTFDQSANARKGYAVDAGIQKLHPEWFAPEVMPTRWSGEDIYDPNGGYFKKGKYIPSMAAEIGYVIEEHLCKLGIIDCKKNKKTASAAAPEKEKEDKPSINDGKMICPVCHERELINQENCIKCLACGHSKCG